MKRIEIPCSIITDLTAVCTVFCRRGNLLIWWVFPSSLVSQLRRYFLGKHMVIYILNQMPIFFLFLKICMVFRSDYRPVDMQPCRRSTYTPLNSVWAVATPTLPIPPRRGYSEIFWVGVCCWDSKAVNLYQTTFSSILQPYSRLDAENPYLAILD